VIRRGRNLPLAAWAALGGTATVVTMVVLVGAVLARGGLDRLEVLALGAGLLVGLVLVSLAVFWTLRVTAGMRELHADAVRRLRDPSLRVALTELDPTELVAVGSLLLADVDALLGADRPHVPLFRNFPTSVPSDTFAFFVDRVLVHFFQDPRQPCVLCGNEGTVAPVNPCGHLVCHACFDGADFSACPICHRRIDPADPFLRAPAERPPASADAAPARLRVLQLGTDLVDAATLELQSLLCRIRLGDEQLVHVDAEPLGICGIECVFGVHERRDASGFLHFGDDLQSECRLAGSFRTEDFDHSAPWQPAHTEGEVEPQGSGRHDFNVRFARLISDAHDGALSKQLVDLLKDRLERCVPACVYHAVFSSRNLGTT